MSSLSNHASWAQPVSLCDAASLSGTLTSFALSTAGSQGRDSLHLHTATSYWVTARALHVSVLTGSPLLFTCRPAYAAAYAHYISDAITHILPSAALEQLHVTADTSVDALYVRLWRLLCADEENDAALQPDVRVLLLTDLHLANYAVTHALRQLCELGGLPRDDLLPALLRSGEYSFAYVRSHPRLQACDALARARVLAHEIYTRSPAAATAPEAEHASLEAYTRALDRAFQWLCAVPGAVTFLTRAGDAVAVPHEHAYDMIRVVDPLHARTHTFPHTPGDARIHMPVTFLLCGLSNVHTDAPLSAAVSAPASTRVSPKSVAHSSSAAAVTARGQSGVGLAREAAYTHALSRHLLPTFALRVPLHSSAPPHMSTTAPRAHTHAISGASDDTALAAAVSHALASTETRRRAHTDAHPEPPAAIITPSPEVDDDAPVHTPALGTAVRAAVRVSARALQSFGSVFVRALTRNNTPAPGPAPAAAAAAAAASAMQGGDASPPESSSRSPQSREDFLSPSRARSLNVALQTHLRVYALPRADLQRLRAPDSGFRSVMVGAAARAVIEDVILRQQCGGDGRGTGDPIVATPSVTDRLHVAVRANAALEARSYVTDTDVHMLADAIIN